MTANIKFAYNEEEVRYEVGVLGSGDVAQTLAAGFIKYGHEAISARVLQCEAGRLAQKNPEAQVSSVSDTAAFGDVVVLAVKGRPRRMFCAQQAATISLGN